MNKGKPDNAKAEHQNATEEYLNSPLGRAWDTVKKEARTVKFWMELGALVGLLAYTTVAYFQWQTTVIVMRADQRAWLIPSVGPIYLHDGEVIFQDFTYTNTGRTPAKNIHAVFRMQAISDVDQPTFDYSPSRRPSTSDAHAVFPNSGNNLGVPLFGEVPNTNTLEPVKYSDDLKQKFTDHSILFVLHGKVTYTDVFGIDHWFTYCGATISPQTAT
jgi:hypothetical protein